MGHTRLAGIEQHHGATISSEHLCQLFTGCQAASAIFILEVQPALEALTIRWAEGCSFKGIQTL
jgi:hypothetical protein